MQHRESADETTPGQDDLLVKKSELRAISISGKTHSIKHVYDILLLTAAWLIKQGKLRKTGRSNKNWNLNGI